jgi:hypothetical protein
MLICIHLHHLPCTRSAQESTKGLVSTSVLPLHPKETTPLIHWRGVGRLEGNLIALVTLGQDWIAERSWPVSRTTKSPVQRVRSASPGCRHVL